MSVSTPVRSLGWTRRSAAQRILDAVAEQRTQSARRLAEALEASGKSYETVAHEAGVSTKTISRWVNRRHDPSRTTVDRIAKALGVEPTWLWEPPAPLGLVTGEGSANGVPEDLQAQLDRIEANQNDIHDKIDALIVRADLAALLPPKDEPAETRESATRTTR